MNGMAFIDGTHIKASANKKKFQTEQVAKAAKVYEEQFRKEVAEERKKLGKKEKDDDENNGSSGGGTVTKTVSTTNPDCGMFVKGSHNVYCSKGITCKTSEDHNAIVFGPGLHSQTGAKLLTGASVRTKGPSPCLLNTLVQSLC